MLLAEALLTRAQSRVVPGEPDPEGAWDDCTRAVDLLTPLPREPRTIEATAEALELRVELAEGLQHLDTCLACSEAQLAFLQALLDEGRGEWREAYADASAQQAQIHWHRDEAALALAALERAAPIYAALVRDGEELLLELANVHELTAVVRLDLLGDAAGSVAAHTQALASLEGWDYGETLEFEEVAEVQLQILTNLAYARFKGGDPRAALPHLEQAQVLADQLELEAGEQAVIHHVAAEARLALGELDAARAACARAAACFAAGQAAGELELEDHLGACRRTEAKLALAGGDLARAQALADEAVELLERSRDRGQGVIELDLAQARLVQAEVQAARGRPEARATWAQAHATIARWAAERAPGFQRELADAERVGARLG